MRHHFQDHRYGFGVSSPLWDAIMGTLPRNRKAASDETGEPGSTS
jgi:sterol desaturase/sphingolipid hydroxylase (fatty acid hydroxylase superfamily)